MAAGVIGELWDMDRLFDAVMEHANRKVRDGAAGETFEKITRSIIVIALCVNSVNTGPVYGFVDLAGQ